jgi:hypothetical protein
MMRGMPKRLENSAYCVAEKRFCVMRSRKTEKAPVAMPPDIVSKMLQAYISGGL